MTRHTTSCLPRSTTVVLGQVDGAGCHPFTPFRASAERRVILSRAKDLRLGDLSRSAHLPDWFLGPVIEEQLTMAPPPWSSIRGISYFMPSQMPLRLMAMVRFQFSSVQSMVEAAIRVNSEGIVEAAEGLDGPVDHDRDLC
jgi:hypothetical protein